MVKNHAWPRGYKTFFILTSTEHEVSTAPKNGNNEKLRSFFSSLNLSDIVFIMLINVKMPTIVGILTFISRIKFVLS